MEDRPLVSYSTGAMKSLLDKLTEVMKLKKPPVLIQELQQDLQSLNEDLLDQFTGRRETDEQVKVWMKQVRELVYNIEDWIDRKPITKLGKSEREEEEIKIFKAKIHGARERCTRYDLLSKASPDSDLADVTHSNVACSRLLLEEKTVLVAADGPRNKLLEHLTDEQKMLKVVSIVGMEGLGKTTLAKEIYTKLQGQFDCGAFVSVSRRRPSMNTALMEMLLQLKQEIHPCGGSESRGEQQLIRELWEHLGTKRYFIVIDGVWSKQAWKVINCALPDKNQGSRVLTTTCSMDVAKSSTIHPIDVVHQMGPLSKECSIKLFQLSVKEEARQASLKEVSDKMYEICDGMPLAIAVIAGLIARSSVQQAQRNMLGKSSFSASDQRMRKILHMSYADLSVPLKSCFLYLSVFPENYTIKKDHLIRLWRAEGLLPRRDEESFWETGERYFNELASRRLIQPLFDYWYDGQAVGCTVHGVILDFVVSLSRKENFVTVGAELRSGPSPCDKIRRFSLDCNNEDEADTLASSTLHLSNMRSLIVFGDITGIHVLSAFKLIRLLDLENTMNLRGDLLEGIGSLFLLRYLGLAGSNVTKSSLEKIGELQHLVTLDLRRTNVAELPASIYKLRKLVALLGDGLCFSYLNMQEWEELSIIDVTERSSLDALEDVLVSSSRLRMLGVRLISGTVVEVRPFLNKLRKCKLESLVIHGDLEALDGFVPCPTIRRFELSKSLSRVPDDWAELNYLTYLDIRIGQIKSEDLIVLGKARNLVVLKLFSLGYDGTVCMVSKKAFQSLEAACFMCPNGGMGLQFTSATLPKLRRLWLDFNAGKTSRQYGNKFDFGIQFPASLAQVHVAIRGEDSKISDVLHAEESIMEQILRHPKSPSLVLEKQSQPSSEWRVSSFSKGEASSY